MGLLARVRRTQPIDGDDPVAAEGEGPSVR
jgi:hypothetical protein